MNKIFKKLLSFTLIAALLISGYPFIDNVQGKVVTSNIYANSATWYEKGSDITCGEFFSKEKYAEVKAAGLLPKLPVSGFDYPRTITKDNVVYQLNYRIYKQKNLFVYGNYTNPSNNYFKCGYQTHTNLAVLQPDVSYEGGVFSKDRRIKV